jgi:hypothetical protein
MLAKSRKGLGLEPLLSDFMLNSIRLLILLSLLYLKYEMSTGHLMRFVDTRNEMVFLTV